MTPIDKITSLTKYVDSLKNRLNAPIPERHKTAPEQYKAWLNLEIKRTSDSIENLKFYVK